MDLAAALTPLKLATTTVKEPAALAGAAAARAKISKTAKDFEASFLSVMVGQMFSGLQTSAPFGGGQGEQMYKSFLTDSFSKSMAQHGGVGVSKAISAELLKLQGLSA